MNKYFHSFYLLLLVLISGLCLESCKKEPPQQNFSDTLETNFLFELPSIISESSGLINFKNSLLTHNDSGDAPLLYTVDMESGQLENTFLIEQTIHRDWEAITQNNNYIFIGDFGNNSGNRQDLTIYQLDKENLALSDSISFRYANQATFDQENEAHNFNMEAFIAVDSFLYLFSKNHLNLQTDLYQIDLSKDGFQEISILDSLNVEGLVTDAAFWQETKTLVLVGYNNKIDLDVFLWRLPNFQGIFEDISPQKFDLDLQEQVEGITFLNEKTLLISSEKEVESGGNIYEIRLP